MPGFTELMLLIVVLLVVFGAKALPDLGESIGRTIVKRRGEDPDVDPSAKTE